MEHGQRTGESIGAMLSSIASTLREVSDKLDVVAARMDGASPVSGDPTFEDRLAALEAWAFHAGQNISGIDARVQRLESGRAPTGERTEGTDSPAARLPRAATGRRSAGPPERHVAPAPASGHSESRESVGDSRNGASRQDTVRATHELNSAAPSGFTPPREPAATTPEPSSSSGQSFTTPAPREPTPNFTAPMVREPASDLTTPREQINRNQESLTTPREPVVTPHPFPAQENTAFESIFASAENSGPGANLGHSVNGTAADGTATGLTGAHRATEQDHTPVDNSHVDKLQAMLDELKRTAAAPLGRTDVFGTSAGEANSNGYRLSSPPPAS
ncbi:hypothetical protein AB0B25_13030 [Nocardia sp. NPDC049190]|uniref:hypothetical protein n=1 Tax=Nocardia sp. NPDC049190 TaxID=3155650 RepID=UPI0033FC63C6